MPGSTFGQRGKRWLLSLADRIDPSIGERLQTGRFASGAIAPLTATDPDVDPFAHGPRLGHPGIDLDLEAQTDLVRQLGEFRSLFAEIRTNPKVNVQYHQQGTKIRNGYFPTPDAETYLAMIALRKPPTIVEIGGGFSTIVARTVIDAAGLDTDLVVIDPEPRTDVRAAAGTLLLERVEESSFDLAALEPGSFLFIDSSHVLRSGGDVAFLYGEVVPVLPPGVTVHVHDIFLPFDYSAHAMRLWWTEQYVLQALLASSPRYQVELALRWLTEEAPDLMVEVFGRAVTDEPAHGGTSLWFRTVADD